MADICANSPREAVALFEQMNLLMALVSKDAKINLSVLMAYGEVYDDELRVWSDQLITRPNYRGPVSFTPWRNYRPNRFTTETGLHAVVVIIRSAYERVFPDPPTIWATDADAETKQASTSEYVDTHGDKITLRLRDVCEDIKRDEVFHLLTSANVELKQLLHSSAVLKSASPAIIPSVLPDDQIRTMAGDIVLKNELTEEDRPSGEWALICGFSDDTFRNRMSTEAKGPTWRIVESGSQRYRVHVEDLPPKFRGSKKQRDERLRSPKG